MTCPCCGRAHLPLIDRVRAALEMEPDATLGRLLWLTGDRRPEMVATLARMVRLRRERGSVTTPRQPLNAALHTCANAMPPALGSLRASSSGTGRP